MKTELSPRERFLTAFDHREADRVPIFDVPNNPEIFRHFLGKENPFSEGIPHVLLAKKLGMDACFIPDRLYTCLITKERDWLSPNRFVDELGVQYLCNDSSWPLAIPEKEAIPTRDEWEKIILPNPKEKSRYDELRLAVREARKGQQNDIAVLAGMRSGFSVLYISMGLAALSTALYDDPDYVLEAAEKITDYWTGCSLMAVEAGADGIYIANDMGMNSGPLIGPESLGKFFFPSLRRQVQAIRGAGAKVILHSCGNIDPVLADLVSMGIDGYNNLQVSAKVEIGRVKKKYGDRLTLIGNVDSTNVMVSDKAEVIEQAVIQTLRTAASGGGHVIATDHSFHKGIPLRNIEIFLNAAKKWGKYPLSLPEERA